VGQRRPLLIVARRIVIMLIKMQCVMSFFAIFSYIFFFKQKTAYEIGLGIPAEPLFRSVLQTPKATSSTLYFDSLTVNAGNGGFLHCIQMDTSVNAANQVVSVGADIAFDADPKFFACLVRFESSSVP